MKPTSKCQGRGIFIFNKISEISRWKSYNKDNPPEPYVCQKYLMNPLLLGGRKFDMRIYALCTSYNPLTVYLYRAGFARFAHDRYDNFDTDNLCTPDRNGRQTFDECGHQHQCTQLSQESWWEVVSGGTEEVYVVQIRS